MFSQRTQNSNVFCCLWGFKWFQSHLQVFLVSSETLTSQNYIFLLLQHHFLSEILIWQMHNTLGSTIQQHHICITACQDGGSPSPREEISAHSWNSAGIPLHRAHQEWGLALPGPVAALGTALPSQSLMVGQGTQSSPTVFAQCFTLLRLLLIVNQQGLISPPKQHACLEVAQRNICALVKTNQAKSWGKSF